MSAPPVPILAGPIGSGRTTAADLLSRRGPELSDRAVVEQLWNEFADLGEHRSQRVPLGTATPAEVAGTLAFRLRDGELTV